MPSKRYKAFIANTGVGCTWWLTATYRRLCGIFQLSMGPNLSAQCRRFNAWYTFAEKMQRIRLDEGY